MERKVASEIMFILLSISMLTLAFNIQPVKSFPSFTDEFDTSTLDSHWTVIDPDGGSSFDLTTNLGWLRIATTSPPGRDLIGTIKVNAPRVVQPLYGDFIVETKISSIMDENDEGAGILVWKDSSNYLRLERMSRTIGHPVEQQVFFCGTIDGNFPIPGETQISLPTNINPTYLKLIRTGQVFSGYYSSDGVTWNHVADVSFNVDDPIYIGLAIINEYHDGIFFADFDYFRVSAPEPAKVLSLKLSGDFDYSSKEEVKIRLATLVKGISNMEVVSDADVTIEIYHPNGTLWISDEMVEKLSGMGIYEWESIETINQMKLEDGVYLVYVEASIGNGPVASDMMLFHIDPPLESSTSSFALQIYYATAVIVLIAGIVVGIALIRRYRRLQAASN